MECFSRIVFFLFRGKIYESWECVMDKIDKKLITLLQQDARMPLKALAENVFLSSPAVSARIERLEKEQNEAVRKLLQADYDFLDKIQIEMSTARQFMFAIRFRREKNEQIFSTLNRVDKAISEHGFAARRMTKPEIKRMLALYFGTSLSGENIPDIEGENEFDLEKQEVTVNEK